MAVTVPAVEVHQLVKRYPKRPVNAVDGVTFAVATGEVFGLLGPNGAGKTTTVGILTTRVRSTEGTATVVGVDIAAHPVAARRLIGVVPQRNNLDRSLSVRQNLLFHAAYHGVPTAERTLRAAELLDQFGLADRAEDKVDTFSGGQAQRLMVARALMHAPAVIFLDEPTTGLDPAARLFVWDRIRDLQQSGVTVVLTTHDMDEAATLTDRVGIMDSGRLLALDTPAALTRGLAGRFTLEIGTVVDDAHGAQGARGGVLDDVTDALAGWPDVDRVETVAQSGGSGHQAASGPEGGGMRLRLYVNQEPAAMVAPVAELLRRCGARLTDVHLGTPTLEDVFIDLTGRALR